jgi:membrane fusion protein (multidrug efflux system)
MNIKALFKFFIPVMMLIVSACASSDETGKGAVSEGTDRTEAVRVTELQYREIARNVTYTANLQAFREVYLASASPGRIDRIYVEAGTKVAEGQLLVEMDKTQLNQALVQLQNLEKDYRRIDTLNKVGSVPQQQYDQIRTQYEVTRSNVEFLRENTTLVAPFSGTISGKYFENGEMYSGAPNTTAGKAAILSIVQTSRLKALVNISESYYPDIKPGMKVSISSDVYPEEQFTGTVLTVYPTINPATRTFTVEISIPNSRELLRPGMFARATFELEQVKAFVVPAIAVMKLQGSNERFVFLEEGGKARRVVVELGERFDDMLEIISDSIHVGDKLIVAGQARLVDGIAVQVQQ